MKLLLISGHGAGDPGATSVIAGKSYQEADETRRVTAALAKALAGAFDVTVYPTDRNAFEDHQKGTLASVAQFSKYDYVLEIHFNAALAGAADGKTKGVECYVTTPEEKTDVEAAVCAAVAACGLANRGVKRKNWSVIADARRAGVSAALLEVCFIDDPDDMAVYAKQFTNIVQGIADAISAGFGLSGEEPMTYEAFQTYLNRYLEELAALPPSDWSAGDRAWAEQKGILRGNGAGQMKYRSFVTREELAAVLHRAAES